MASIASVLVLSIGFGALQAEPEPLTPAGFASRAPAWSPDGTQIAYETNESGNWDVAILDVVSGLSHVVASSLADERYPTWSPDGESVALIRTGPTDSDILVVELGGGRPTVIPLPGDQLFPHWSPDGRAIAYTSALGGTLSLRTVDLLTGTESTLLDPPGRDVWPRWAPDGGRIAFFSRRDTEGNDDEVYVLDVEAKTTRRLTISPGHDFCPAWSPDGRRLVIVDVQSDGNRWLQILDDSGVELARIGQGFYRVTEPSWSPDGIRIAYAARRTADASYRIYVESIPDDGR